VTLKAAGSDQRAFKLVNKTNQFNLNGVWYTETEWKVVVPAGVFFATVSYDHIAEVPLSVSPEDGYSSQRPETVIVRDSIPVQTEPVDFLRPIFP
jgi:hypothetical protein